MLSGHCIRLTVCAFGAALVAMAGPVPGLAQTAPSSTFTIFLRSIPIGSEQIAIERTAEGWTISSTGRIGPPLDIVLRKLQAKYDPDWKPLVLSVDALMRGEPAAIETTVSGTTARSVVRASGGAATETSETIDPQSIFLPNPFVAPYEALSAQLKTLAEGATIAVHQPGVSFSARVGPSVSVRIQTAERTLTARHTRLMFEPGGGTPPLSVDIWGDEAGRLLRVSIPAQNLEVTREDLASVASRTLTMSRPNDEDVRIPANGFSLAGTVSKPTTGAPPFPAVILVGGSGPTDRDETAFGIPIFGQLAHSLADAGFLVLRYDKRGIGQSGGRPESAALTDFAEDTRAAVRMLSQRRDVDRKKIALVGHSEGGWVALLAAAKTKSVVAVGLIAAPGVQGKDLNLYQVTHALDRSERTPAEKQATIELQKKIQNAVLNGTGWEDINLPPATRRQAETPWFQSFLAFDPAKAMKDVDQPMLIIHGELDTQVPPSNAARLETLARGRKNSGNVELVRVPGINHLLVPATTGEFDEYGTLADRQIGPAVADSLAMWLHKTFALRR